jgi:hypothetical protein
MKGTVLESMEGMKCPAVKCLRVLSWTSFSSSGRARCNSIFLHLPNHGEQAAAMVGCMGLLVLSWEAICCSRTEKGKGQPAVVGGETAEAEVAPSRRAAGERTAGRGRGWGACYRRFSEIGEVEADLAGWRLGLCRGRSWGLAVNASSHRIMGSWRQIVVRGVLIGQLRLVDSKKAKCSIDRKLATPNHALSKNQLWQNLNYLHYIITCLCTIAVAIKYCDQYISIYYYYKQLRLWLRRAHGHHYSLFIDYVVLRKWFLLQ